MTYASGSILVAPQAACTCVEGGFILGWNVVVPTPPVGPTGYRDGVGQFLSFYEQVATADALPLSELYSLLDDMKQAAAYLLNDSLTKVELAIINGNFYEVNDQFDRIEVALLAYDILDALEDTFTRAETVDITNS